MRKQSLRAHSQFCPCSSLGRRWVQEHVGRAAERSWNFCSFMGSNGGAAVGGPALLCSVMHPDSAALCSVSRLLCGLFIPSPPFAMGTFTHASLAQGAGLGSYHLPLPPAPTHSAGPLTPFQGSSGQECWLPHCCVHSPQHDAGLTVLSQCLPNGCPASTELQGITSYPISKIQAPPT